jgi:hypothetical protein
VLIYYCSGGVRVVELWYLFSYSGVEIAAYDGGELGLRVVQYIF